MLISEATLRDRLLVTISVFIGKGTRNSLIS